MKHCWLHQQGNKDCLLFFAGWGMCPEPFQDIPAGSFDVLMIYDYRRIELGELNNISKSLQEQTRYQKIHLLAWSMGVWVAASLLAQKNFPQLRLAEFRLAEFRLASAIAIGGTCHPIHDKLGLPEQNFNDMAEQLSPTRVEAFQDSMFTDQQEAQRFSTSFQKGNRSVKGLQQELLALARASASQQIPPDIYTSKIITGRDRIFPARNQVRAWGRKECRTLSLPHFPFYHWPNWAAMIAALT